jgi:NAD+ synthase (glutamine-hydrolysing)
MRLILAQLDFAVGAVQANLERVRAACAEGELGNDDLILFPELTLAGYPPDDLLLRPGFLARCEAAVAQIDAWGLPGHVLVGHPWHVDERLYNALSWWHDGALQLRYLKQALPNYAVFDEKRYFGRGDASGLMRWGEVRVGVLLCEDIWAMAPAARAVADGAELLLVANASPYHAGKRAEREAMLRLRAREHGVAIAYVNLVGGQDDLIFDGQSMAVNADGSIAAVVPAFADSLFAIEYDPLARRFDVPPWHVEAPVDESGLIYEALVRATADYVRKNGFQRVLLGLSGGIDSALTLAIAVDALGADQVEAILLPSRYTSDLSNAEAARQAELLGVQWHSLPIEAPFQAFVDTLAPRFAGLETDVTEENLQSRCRGVLLMALSNKFGSLLLSTGNKSEMAMGYATLYGDMCGAFAPLKDLYKTEVYALSRWRNTQSPAIPAAVIERPPSAELRANQVDQDTLPPYEQLDAILYRFIELDRARADIIAEGYPAEVVQRVGRQVLINEYKRRQAPPGPKVSRRAFGRERRYPVSSGYR